MDSNPCSVLDAESTPATSNFVHGHALSLTACESVGSGVDALTSALLRAAKKSCEYPPIVQSLGL